MTNDTRKPREFKLGTIEGGARDGGDIFAVLDCNPKVTFGDMLKGFHVIEYSAYEALRKELDDAQNFLVGESKLAVRIAGLKFENEDLRKERDEYRAALEVTVEVLKNHGIGTTGLEKVLAKYSKESK